MNIRQSLKFATIISHYHRNQWLAVQYIKKHQLRKLKSILEYSFRYVPFYREVAQHLRINVSDISSIDDLRKLPVVTKKLIQENPEDFYSLKGKRELWYSSKSSGSTGEPLEVFFDPHCWMISRYALKLRSLYATGFPVWGKIVIVRLVEPKKLRLQWKSLRLPFEVFFKRRRYLSTYESADSHLKFYQRFRPYAIHGPPSYFMSLMEAMENNKEGSLHVPIVFCASELLDNGTRKLIGKYLGAEVFDIYGCTEFKDVAWECAAHDGYHVNVDNLLVEIVQDGNPAPVEHEGDILLTSLINRAMPLIRYKVGDRGSLSERVCACGRGLPLMKVIEGRVVDFIQLPDGGKISPYGAINLLEEIPELQRFQLLQRTDFSLDVNLIASETSENGRASLIFLTENLLRNEVGPKIPIRCNIVEHIAVKPGEKFRIVSSEHSEREKELR
jgi:phenylacetate-CoA ligase